MAKGQYSDLTQLGCIRHYLIMERQTLIESSYYHIPTNQIGDAESCTGAYLPP